MKRDVSKIQYVTRLLQSLIILMALVSPAVTAEIHQWTDAQGNTHFGDKPPKNTDSKLLEIKLQTGPVDPIVEKSKEQLLREQAEQENQRLLGEILKRQAIEKEAKALMCTDARERLSVLQQDTPIYPDEQGNLRAHWVEDTYQGERRYLSDAQRSAEVNKAYQSISMNCQNPADRAEQVQIHNDWYNAQYCDAARSELERYEKPSSRSDSETVNNSRERVKKYCK